MIICGANPDGAVNMKVRFSMAKVLLQSFATIFLLFGVVSCSQILDLNCNPPNWHRQGLKDGAHGAPPRAADEYERTCSHRSLEFDRLAYEAGLEEGNAHYCTRQNGFDLGMNGFKSEKVCTNEDAQAFDEAFKAGRALHRAVMNLEQVTSYSELNFVGNAVAQARYSRIKQELANSQGSNDDRSRELRSMQAELTSRLGSGQYYRVHSSGRIPVLVVKCEKAKRRAEELGFYVGFKCS